MNYEDFICFVQKEMAERLGEEVCVELHRVTKNNSVVLDGLSVQTKNSRIAPTIYLNDFYEEYKKGMSIPNILECIADVYDNSKVEEGFDPEVYMNFEKMKAYLACKLINREKNLELLKDVPYLPFLDLAIVAYCKFSEKNIGRGTILIHRGHMKAWGIEESEMFQVARANTRNILPEELTEIYSMLHKSPEEEEALQGERTGQIPMYVLSNTENYFGAVNIIYDGVLEKAAGELGGDLWILPSSIHECILIPAKASVTREELKAMVKEVNQEEVAEEDFLSDEVYYYEQCMHRLEMV